MEKSIKAPRYHFKVNKCLLSTLRLDSLRHKKKKKKNYLVLSLLKIPEDSHVELHN